MATATPTFVSGVGAIGTVTSNSTTVVASGSPGPYSYAWAKVSGDTITPNSPSAATTTFSGSPGIGTTITAVFRCTVTGASQSSQSNNVVVELERV